MPTDLPSTILFIGRLLLGGGMFVAGIRNTMGFAVLRGLMAGKVPMPDVALIIGIAMLVAGGGLLAIGVWVPLAAAILIIFVAMATAMFHDFWTLPPGPDRVQKINSFMSNVMLIGGLLIALASGL